jgi:hypothetical protein
MDDRHPATDDQQPVHLDYSYPDAAQLNRRLQLVKLLLAIPHYIVLFFLEIGTFVAWSLRGSRFCSPGLIPRRLFDFAEGVRALPFCLGWSGGGASEGRRAPPPGPRAGAA